MDIAVRCIPYHNKQYINLSVRADLHSEIGAIQFDYLIPRDQFKNPETRAWQPMSEVGAKAHAEEIARSICLSFTREYVDRCENMARASPINSGDWFWRKPSTRGNLYNRRATYLGSGSGLGVNEFYQNFVTQMQQARSADHPRPAAEAAPAWPEPPPAPRFVVWDDADPAVLREVVPNDPGPRSGD